MFAARREEDEKEDAVTRPIHQIPDVARIRKHVGQLKLA
jgi:hypothetical protein